MPAPGSAGRTACGQEDASLSDFRFPISDFRLSVGHILAAPELLFDFFDFLLAHPEVMTELVDDSLRDAIANLVLVLAGLLDRPLVDRNPIRQGVAVAP